MQPLARFIVLVSSGKWVASVLLRTDDRLSRLHASGVATHACNSDTGRSVW